jgi:hypothetical protein
MDMEKRFEILFGLPFNNITCIFEINSNVDTYDEGVWHFIDLTNNDIYSFNTYSMDWLEKNVDKDDVLYRLNINT